ncbi:hypothetical protein D3C81_1921920 [compost metagenome]
MIRATCCALDGSLGLIPAVRIISVAFSLAREDMIVTRSAVPSAPAIVRSVLDIAVPCALSRAGSWLRPAVWIGIISMDIPNIRAVYIRMRCV